MGPDQMASKEATSSGSTPFSIEFTSGFIIVFALSALWDK